MMDEDYNELYGHVDKAPALSAGVIVVVAIVALCGIAISFQGSVQF